MHHHRSLGHLGSLLIVGLLVGCDGGYTTGPGPQDTGTGPPTAQAAVSVGDNFFNPANRSVTVGGTVTWTWTGQVGHTVTFPSGTSSSLQTSGTFARVFPNAGSFGYQCAIHGASMSGTIIVG